MARGVLESLPAITGAQLGLLKIRRRYRHYVMTASYLHVLFEWLIGAALEMRPGDWAIHPFAYLIR